MGVISPSTKIVYKCWQFRHTPCMAVFSPGIVGLNLNAGVEWNINALWSFHLFLQGEHCDMSFESHNSNFIIE